jgi:hypothetical protein
MQSGRQALSPMQSIISPTSVNVWIHESHALKQLEHAIQSVMSSVLLISTRSCAEHTKHCSVVDGRSDWLYVQGVLLFGLQPHPLGALSLLNGTSFAFVSIPAHELPLGLEGKKSLLLLQAKGCPPGPPSVLVLQLFPPPLL